MYTSFNLHSFLTPLKNRSGQHSIIQLGVFPGLLSHTHHRVPSSPDEEELHSTVTMHLDVVTQDLILRTRFSVVSVWLTCPNFRTSLSEQGW